MNSSEYSVVLLKDVDADVTTDMLVKGSYIYNASASSMRQFQIICSIAPVEYYHLIPLVAGWNLVSLPSDESVNKENITVNYSGANHTWQEAVDDGVIIGFIYDWNETGQNYGFTDTLAPGQGYWMYAYDDCDLWITGNAYDDDYITDLLEEWNLIGLPYDEPVAKDNLTIYYSGTNYSWQDAVNSNIIIGFIYDWDETGQNYGFADVLNPGEGYWIYAYQYCTLRRTET